jgi:hypothetical protein
MSISEVWKYLHDGSIESIEGSVPGDVTVHVSIRYIRQRFPGDGTGFIIVLSNCTRFEFEPYDEPACNELAEIVRLDPEIVSLQSADPVVVNCVMGTLNLAYTHVTVTLDSGVPVSLEALHAASAGYWEEWSQRNRKT